MNYPDFLTCEAIGAEFPESKLVYAVHDNTWTNRTTPIIVIDGRAWNIYRRSQIRTDQLKLVTPAPSCEELGEWLYNYTLDNAGYVLIKDKIVEAWINQSSVSETQARAEAVKLILESNK